MRILHHRALTLLAAVVVLAAMIPVVESHAATVSSSALWGSCAHPDIPTDFAIDTCFDGTTLTLANNTPFVLEVDLSRPGVSERRERHGDAGRGLAEQKAANATPDRVLPPGFSLVVEPGPGEMTVEVSGWSMNPEFAVDKLFAENVGDVTGYDPAIKFLDAVREAAFDFAACREQYTNSFSLSVCEYRNRFRAIGAGLILYGEILWAASPPGTLTTITSLIHNYDWWIEYYENVERHLRGEKTFTLGSDGDAPPPTTRPLAPAAQVTPITGVDRVRHFQLQGLTPGGEVGLRYVLPDIEDIVVVATVTVDADGSHEGSFVLRDSDPPGVYLLVVNDRASGHEFNTRFTLLDSGDDPEPSSVDISSYLDDGEIFLGSFEIDLDGDGQDEIVLETVVPEELCGGRDGALDFGAGIHQLRVLRYEGGTWRVALEVGARPDAPEAFAEGASGHTLEIVDFSPGPGVEVLWTRSALGGCGNNFAQDSHLIGWSGTGVSSLLHLQAYGAVYIQGDALVGFDFVYAGDDAHCCPSACVASLYAWEQEGMTKVAEFGPTDCDQAELDAQLYFGDAGEDFDDGGVAGGGELVLRSDGLGLVPFGADADGVFDVLVDVLGPPIDDTGWFNFGDAGGGTCIARDTTFPDGIVGFFEEDRDTGSRTFVGFRSIDPGHTTAQGFGVGSAHDSFPASAEPVASDFTDPYLQHDGLRFFFSEFEYVGFEPVLGGEVTAVQGGRLGCPVT